MREGVEEYPDFPKWYDLWWDDFKDGLYELGNDLSEKNPSQVYIEFTNYLINEYVKPKFENSSESTQAFVSSTIAVTRGFFALPLVFSDLGLNVGKNINSEYTQLYNNDILTAEFAPGFKVLLLSLATLYGTGEEFFNFGKGMLVDFPLMTMKQVNAYLNQSAPSTGFEGGLFFGELGISLYLLGKMTKGIADIKKGPPIKFNLKMPDIFPRPPALTTASAIIATDAHIPISVTVPSGFGGALGNFSALGLRGHQLETNKMMRDNGSTPDKMNHGNSLETAKASQTSNRFEIKVEDNSSKVIIKGKEYPLTPTNDQPRLFECKIRDRKYTFNEDGELLHVETIEKFGIEGKGRKLKIIINGKKYSLKPVEGDMEMLEAKVHNLRWLFNRDGLRIKGTIRKPIIIREKGEIKKLMIDGAEYDIIQYDNQITGVVGVRKRHFYLNDKTTRAETDEIDIRESYYADTSKIEYYYIDGQKIVKLDEISPDTKYEFIKKGDGQTVIILNGEEIKIKPLPDGNIELILGRDNYYFNSNGLRLMGTDQKAIVIQTEADIRVIIDGRASIAQPTKNGYLKVYGSGDQRFFTQDGTRLMGTIEKPVIIEELSGRKEALINGQTLGLGEYKDGRFMLLTTKGLQLYDKDGILIPTENGKPVILERRKGIFNSQPAEPLTIFFDGSTHDVIRLDNGFFEETIPSHNITKRNISLFFDRDGYPLFEHTMGRTFKKVDGEDMVLLAEHNGYGYYLAENHLVAAVDLATGKRVSHVPLIDLAQSIVDPTMADCVITNKNGTPLVIIDNGDPYIIMHDLTEDGNIRYARSVKDGEMVALSDHWKIFNEHEEISLNELQLKFDEALKKSGKKFTEEDLAPARNLLMGKRLGLNGMVKQDVILIGKHGSMNTITFEFSDEVTWGRSNSSGLYVPDPLDIYSALKLEPWSLVKRINKIVIKAEEKPSKGTAFENNPSSTVADIDKENGVITFYGIKTEWTRLYIEEVLTHELGHLVEAGKIENYRLLIMAQKLDEMFEGFMITSIKDSTYHLTALAERMAEFLTLYFRDLATRERCRQNAPHVTMLVEQKLAELAANGINITVSSVAIKELLALFFEDDKKKEQ